MRGGDRCYFFCWGNYFIIFYYIANDIACGSNGHRREFNVELALILETENLVNFQCITRVRRTLMSSNGRGSFGLSLDWFTRATVPESSFDATLFLLANAWLPGEIKVIELAEMTRRFCL